VASRSANAGLVVLTIGHSNRPLASFLECLSAHRVQTIADVRTIPRSRHNPQFNRDALPASLEACGVGYRHLASLGGLRRARPDSPNLGWRNASFRGYADYMQTAEFEAALDDLIELARHDRVAAMCAEAVPWRCHRSLIADALVVRGIAVEHILSPARRDPHRLTPWARREGLRIVYPAAQGDLGV
jgi:uncharacterized protein (DUF488 family)